MAERPSLSCSHKLPGRNSASSKRSRREAAAAPGSGRCPRSSVSRQQQAGRASSAAAAFPAPTSTRRAQRCRTAQPSARACPGLDLIPGCFSSQGLTREPPAHSSPQGGTRAGAAGRAEVTAGQLPSQRRHGQKERKAPRSWLAGRPLFPLQPPPGARAPSPPRPYPSSGPSAGAEPCRTPWRPREHSAALPATGNRPNRPHPPRSPGSQSPRPAPGALSQSARPVRSRRGVPVGGRATRRGGPLRMRRSERAGRGGPCGAWRAGLRACAGRDVRVGRALSGGSTGLRAWARRELWGVASGPSRAARMRGAGRAVVADVGAIRGAERGCALRDAVGPVVPDAGGGVHRGAGAVGHPRAGRALQPAEPSYRALRGWPGGVAGTGCREGRLGGGGLGRAGGPLSWRGGRCLGCARCWKPKETRRAARHEELQLGLGSLASVRDPRRNAGRSQGGAVGNGVRFGEA